jgi:hypothetical protein
LHSPSFAARNCRTHDLNVLHRILCAIALLYAVGLNAISPHMEIRFLLPSLPFLHLLAGSTIRDVYIWSCNRKRSW